MFYCLREILQQSTINQESLVPWLTSANSSSLTVTGHNMAAMLIVPKNRQSQEQRESQAKNPMTDPSMMTDMMKGNVTNVLPMIVIGGWINWAFSGFLTTKVPFPLTFRFKPMLQRGVELITLDASWVSSASWYFLNVFGLRSMYTLILGQDNAADQTRAMQDQMSGSAMMAPPDPMKAFKAEWEALEVVYHDWMLEGVEEELTGGVVHPETIYLRTKN
ncbi:ER membrane protein complex subunit 3-like [Plakobranchus ocellatus]|uniref:ER membrane protein complex subunit 3 n=1 Tax=Plakobranchus ocellatus TaxID=259542 RepID=A0AAV4B9Y2_9GAST|nr:ER membrane protein complex subunit 3-like [Plakobranchus ocellatus]